MIEESQKNIKKNNKLIHSGDDNPPISPKKRRWLLWLLIISNIVAIGIPLFLELARGEFHNPAKSFNINMIYLLPAFGCFAVAILSEWIRYMCMMKAARGRWLPWVSFQIGAIGRYYDAVTPSGVGGQPFQIYYMNKENVHKGSAASVPITAFALNQFAFTIIAVVVMIIGVRTDESVVMLSAFVGLFLYFMIPFSVILLSVMPGKLMVMLKALLWCLHKLHLVKDTANKFDKWSELIQAYRNSIVEIGRQAPLLILTMLFSLLYHIAILTTPYFVLKAFGADDVTITYVFATNVMIYCAVSIVPTPGNSGAAEGMFYHLFKAVSPGYAFWATLTWRFFSYYGFLIMGWCVFVLRVVKSKREKQGSNGEHNYG